MARYRRVRVLGSDLKWATMGLLLGDIKLKVPSFHCPVYFNFVFVFLMKTGSYARLTQG